MSDDIRERISALLDNQCSPGEQSSALDDLDSRDLRQSWDRYHLIGDLMRGEGLRLNPEGVARGVRERITQEPAILAAPRSRTRPGAHPVWLKPAAGAAIAASVAVLAVLTLPQFINPAPDGQPMRIAATPSTISTQPPPRLPTDGTRWKNLKRPEVESRLNRYLVDHSEYASPGGMGVLPYASFVSYDSDRP